MDEIKITSAFANFEKNYVVPELNSIYKTIYENVRNISPEMLASKITTLESKAVNAFYLELESKANQVATNAMREAGVPETQIPMTWVKVRRAVKTPQAKLCNQQNYSTPAALPTQQESVQGTEPPVGKWLLISGAAVEVVAWLFLPSVKVWAPIVKGIGLLLLGTGAYRIYQEQKPSRIELTEEAIKAAKVESAKAIKNICLKQCELNMNIYIQWLRQICNEIVAECAKLV